MKILSKSFFGTHHSWSHVMRSIMTQFSKNHTISIDSINGYENCSDHLKGYSNNFIGNADLEICYTLPVNFDIRFKEKSKVKMAIYNYESSKLPLNWLGQIDHIDYCLPSSSYSRQIFIDNGWSQDKCVLIPHGINIEEYSNDKTLKYFDKINSYKFLCVAIPHYRKRLDLILESYYSAFEEKDDVLLILKTSLKKPEKYFELDIKKLLIEKQRKFSYKKIPQVMIVDQEIDTMIPLYNSIDCIVNASSGEGFGMPLLECMALGKQIIAPEIGGHTDFLNKSNSFLIKSKYVDAPKEHQYWESTHGSRVVLPNGKELSDIMRFLFLGGKKSYSINIEKFCWSKVSDKILKIIK